MRLESISTVNLVQELLKREGVKKIVTEPHAAYKIEYGDEDFKGSGPATILIVTD